MSHLKYFLFICRFDLDQLDTPDKYPERFTVMLNFKVSPKERPPDKNYPWDKFDVHKLSPKILFSSKDELHEMVADYGRFIYWWSYKLGNVCCACLALQCCDGREVT